MHKNKIKEGNFIFTVIIYVIIILICFITIYPMYYVFILSISNPEIAATLKVYFIPKGFTISSYVTLIKDSNLWRAYFNTIFYAVTTTILMLITCILAAYPLTIKGLIGRKYLTIFLLIPMYFSGGMIPSFLLITKLGLYGNPLSQILPACFSIWNIILMKAYFSTIPESLREASKMDGANAYQILFKVYLPISTPILAVIAVYTIVSMWNSWFNALVYLPKTDWQPLQLYLRRVLIENTADQVLDPDAAKALAELKLSNAQLKYSMIIFTTLPVLLTYPFFQKYFVKGIMLGSLKE